jgi:hypothetical protein
VGFPGSANGKEVKGKEMNGESKNKEHFAFR